MIMRHGLCLLIILASLHCASPQGLPPVAEIPGSVKDMHGMTFVPIPSGSFQMGGDGASAEEPVHTVSISKPFLLGESEVTQALWEKVMGNNPSFYKHPNHPMENVSWLEVQDFIKKLNALEPGSVYRLPTEAEWEYAARAGSVSKFCFGNSFETLDQYAWTRRNAGKKHHPVRTRKPNDWGLYDMHGNVWEWCADYYSAYLSGQQLDPIGPEVGTERVYRGGSFHYAPHYSQCAYRLRFKEDYRSIFIGFRLVLEKEAIQ